MAIMIGTYIGRKSNKSSWTPQSSDLDFWVKENSRSGIILTDFVNPANSPTILPSCGLCNETNYLRRTVADFASGVTAATGGYVERRVYYDGGAGYKVLFSSCDFSGSGQQFNLYINAGQPQINVITGGVSNSFKANDVLSTGWHILRFASIAQKYQIKVDGNVVACTLGTGSDNGKWIGDVTSRDNVNIGYVHRSAPFAGAIFYDDYCDFNGTNKWYISGQGIYEYDVIGGQDMTWTGTSHVYYGNNQSNHFLDVGYSLFTKVGSQNEYIPYTSIGVPCNRIAAMEALHYTFVGNIAGDVANYNIAPALIEFSDSIINYDRSDVTIHKAAARAGSDYDAGNPFRWRGIDISNPDIYYSWKNEGHEAKQFTKIESICINPVKAKEFISYTVNKSSSQKVKIEEYCGIDSFGEDCDINIILFGDKTASFDEANNTIINNIIAAEEFVCIIGTGDYDDAFRTTTQIMAGITGLPSFASPGNHDDWDVGVRSGFNANFNGGGYRKVSAPNVDFFLYDLFLKMDESGYYTLAEAYAITLAARQASTQGLWLISQLAASSARFKVVAFHVPAWSSDSIDDEVVYVFEQMRWDWKAMGVDLIIDGHFHYYERLLKNTGSGNVSIINTGTSGAGQIAWGDVDVDSIVRYNSIVDSDFSAGHLVKMNVTRNKLQIDLSGVDTDGVVHEGKDQLIITK